jgi:hypothetical protein
VIHKRHYKPMCGRGSRLKFPVNFMNEKIRQKSCAKLSENVQFLYAMSDATHQQQCDGKNNKFMWFTTVYNVCLCM